MERVITKAERDALTRAARDGLRDDISFVTTPAGRVLYIEDTPTTVVD